MINNPPALQVEEGDTGPEEKYPNSVYDDEVSGSGYGYGSGYSPCPMGQDPNYYQYQQYPGYWNQADYGNGSYYQQHQQYYGYPTDQYQQQWIPVPGGTAGYNCGLAPGGPHSIVPPGPSPSGSHNSPSPMGYNDSTDCDPATTGHLTPVNSRSSGCSGIQRANNLSGAGSSSPQVQQPNSGPPVTGNAAPLGMNQLQVCNSGHGRTLVSPGVGPGSQAGTPPATPQQGNNRVSNGQQQSQTVLGGPQQHNGVGAGEAHLAAPNQSVYNGGGGCMGGGESLGGLYGGVNGGTGCGSLSLTPNSGTSSVSTGMGLGGLNNSTNSSMNNINKSKPKVSKARRKKRDPNEPQKPVSAYALFFRDTQASIKMRNPNANFGEVSKIVAATWDSLDPDSKATYKKRTEMAKKEYLRALAAYRATMVSRGSGGELYGSLFPPYGHMVVGQPNMEQNMPPSSIGLHQHHMAASGSSQYGYQGGFNNQVRAGLLLGSSRPSPASEDLSHGGESYQAGHPNSHLLGPQSSQLHHHNQQQQQNQLHRDGGEHLAGGYYRESPSRGQPPVYQQEGVEARGWTHYTVKDSQDVSGQGGIDGQIRCARKGCPRFDKAAMGIGCETGSMWLAGRSPPATSAGAGSSRPPEFCSHECAMEALSRLPSASGAANNNTGEKAAAGQRLEPPHVNKPTVASRPSLSPLGGTGSPGAAATQPVNWTSCMANQQANTDLMVK